MRYGALIASQPRPIHCPGVLQIDSGLSKFPPLLRESPGSVSDKIGQKEVTGRWQENQTTDDYPAVAGRKVEKAQAL
jgi:hypothetical protein